MTDAQKHLLMLFKEINEICKKNNIIYYLAGGTLLGAIRHKGFIPWDDDMDILMTRENWHKFIEVSQREMPDNRILECQELNREYPNMIGRYTDKTTSAIHENQILGKGVAGYVIDILVLDPISDDETAYLNYRNDLMLYSDLINPTLNYSYRWGINKKRYNQYYRKIKKVGKEKVLSEIEERLFQYNEAECNKYVMRWGGAPFLFDKDMYGSSRWIMFEDELCRIPDRTIDYLVWHYGDNWMYIPPHNEQESHNAIFSFTTSYENIQKDYMPYIDANKYEKMLIKRKKFFFRNMKMKMKENEKIAETMAVAAKLEIEKIVEKRKLEIKNLFEEKEYERLYSIFEKYYEVQNNRKLIGREDYLGIYRFNNPILVELDEYIFYIAITVLANTNRMAKAARFIDVWEKKKGYINNDIKSIKDLIFEIRNAVSSYDIGEGMQALECISRLYKEWPNNISIQMFYIRLLLEKGDISKAREIIERSIELYPKVGDFYKYLGDCYYNENNEYAYQLYDYAYKNTKNGYILLEIEEYISKKMKRREYTPKKLMKQRKYQVRNQKVKYF